MRQELVLQGLISIINIVATKEEKSVGGGLYFL
jgi:hypothetical protein